MSLPTTLESPSTYFDIPSLSAPTFNWRAALSLAHASKLSYQPRSVVQNTCLNTWKFNTVDFIDKDDTQCLVASSDGVILVTFRGTESLGDWIRNINIFTSNRPYGRVHSGFLDGYEVVKKPLEAKIQQLLSGSEREKKAIVVTGHSLGGALALIAAAEWREKFDGARTVYTYGQPAVGRRAFRQYMKKYYNDKYFRFVNDDDGVARLPPLFSHVGKLFHFEEDGSLRGQTETILRFEEEVEMPRTETMSEDEFEKLKEQLGGGEERFTEGQVLGEIPWLEDHRVDEYIRLIDAAQR